MAMGHHSRPLHHLSRLDRVGTRGTDWPAFLIPIFYFPPLKPFKLLKPLKLFNISIFNLLQPILVTLILAACVAYTARRLWKRFRTPQGGDPHCAGCPLADTCQHRQDGDSPHHGDRQDCPRGTTCDCCH